MQSLAVNGLKENSHLHVGFSNQKAVKGLNYQTFNTDTKIEVKTTLLSEKLKSAISRKRPVELIISCEYNRNKRQSAKQAIKTIIGSIGGYVSRTGKTLDIRLDYLGADGEIKKEGNIPKYLGEEVTALIHGPDLDRLGLIASASDCFVSPDSVPNEQSLKYYLMRDMCPEDDTLKIERYGSGQKITFQSFKFAQNENAFLHLHCDILACTSQKSCGTCIKKWRQISAVWIKNWKNRVRKQMVFDVTTIQPLTVSNIRCEKDGMRFIAKPADFPRWQGDQLYIGKCNLNKDFTGFASYKECGITTKERRQQVIMTTSLKGVPKRGRITRARPIKYTLRCGYDRFLSQSTTVGIETTSDVAAGSITEVVKSPLDLVLSLLGKDGFPYTKHVLEVGIDEEVGAVIGGYNLEDTNIYLHATDCFVTPSEKADDENKYDLLVNSCPVDPTFRIQRYGFGQKLFFHSFAFVHDPEAKLYLHCDVIACLPNSDCGVCNSKKRKRRRRSAMGSLRLDATAIGVM